MMSNMMLLSAAEEKARGFALRFRTEKCRTYEACGKCNYRDKCMFAHGDDEMRTSKMNEIDGLVDEKAIRGWIRDRRRDLRRLRALQALEAEAAAATAVPATQAVDDFIASSATVSSSNSSRRASSSSAATDDIMNQCYRFDPYSWQQVRKIIIA